MFLVWFAWGAMLDFSPTHSRNDSMLKMACALFFMSQSCVPSDSPIRWDRTKRGFFDSMARFAE